MSLILYLRGVVAAVFLVFWTALLSILILVEGLLRRKRAFQDYVMGVLWPRPVFWISGIEFEFRGHQNIPSGGMLFVFNHTSFIDIFVMTATLPRVPRFGAKIELFKLPFFGPAMRATGALPILRSNREAVLELYRETEARVANGECFALAPEGTRQTGQELGKFKTGPFIFAINAKMPVVPVVIGGAERIMPRGTLLVNTRAWRSKIIVEALPPIQGRDYNMDQLVQLQSLVRTRMAEKFADLNREIATIDGKG